MRPACPLFLRRLLSVSENAKCRLRLSIHICKELLVAFCATALTAVTECPLIEQTMATLCVGHAVANITPFCLFSTCYNVMEKSQLSVVT